LSVQKIVQGSLYQNGVQVSFSSAPVVYMNNAVLELKSSGTDIEWLVIKSGAHEYLLSTKNLLSGISYNQLNIQGFTNGNSLITIGDFQYKIRLISNQEWDKFVLNQINLNTLLTPNSDDLSGNYNSTTITASDSNNLFHWWKSSSLTKDVIGNSVIVRGGDSIGKSINILATDNSNYRIMLEKFNLPPIISDSDRFLGSFTSSVTQEYNIIDPENDLFKLEESLDNVVTRTLENQPSKTKFTYSLSGTAWNSLSAGQHTITIRVTDVCDNVTIRNWTFSKIVDNSTGISNNLTRPMITTSTNSLLLSPIDALVDNQINFTVTGGELVYTNEIQILDSSNSSITVYNKKLPESFDFYNTIPQNTLINGKIYQIKIRTYNSIGQYSAWSDTVLIKCLTPPTLIISTIIDGKIQSPNPVMMATYNQAEHDELYSYTYNLYKDGGLVATSEVLLDKLLQYQFNNLENKTNYVIELKVKTASGMETSVSQDFYCLYLQAKMPAVMKASNSPSTGSVKITTYIRQIRGRIYSGDNINYIDGEWADLHNTIVIWDEQGAFRLEGDWTTEIWARDLENNVMLIKFNLDDKNYIELTRFNNMFALTKYVGGIKLYELHSFIEGDILSTDVLHFFIQNDTNLGLMNFDVKRVTDGRNTWFTKSYDNDNMPSYASENGFISGLNDNFKNVILDNNIDGDIVKIYIPTVDELKWLTTSSVLGKSVLGKMVLGNSNQFVDIRSDVEYFTRTVDDIDTNKLKTIKSDGSVGYANPSEKLGIRFVVKIPNTTKVSTYKDIDDNYYNMTFKVLKLFSIQDISNLKIGDKIKANCVKYKNKIIKFTICKKDDTSVYLLSDVVTEKEFDSSETIYANGNPNWSLSNIKQWLNSNIKIG